MIEMLQKAALAGGKVLLDYFRQELLDISQKSDHSNIVTQADTESQTLIQEIIISEMKKMGISEEKIGFIGEEDELHTIGKHTFIIDPLDGTANFASGIDYFCLPIAYVHENEIKASVVYHPTLQNMYTAEKGKGAFESVGNIKKRLFIKKQHIRDTLLVTYFFEKRNHLTEKILKLYPKFRSLRMFGAGALDVVHVADNTIGVAMFETTNIWDIAASKLILNEAGGEVYDWQGEQIRLNYSDPTEKYTIIACHSDVKDEIVELMKSS